jgi:hypothetical protein
MAVQIASTTPNGHALDRNPYRLDRAHPAANARIKPRPRRSSAYMSVMKLSAATPNRVSIYLGGSRWKRGGMYHISQWPQRDVLHQQDGSQLHVQLNGLRMRSRRVRAT